MILVRSTPSGISSIINENGKVIKSLDNNKEGFINYNIFKSSIKKDCGSTLMISLLLLILSCTLGIFYDRIRK